MEKENASTVEKEDSSKEDIRNEVLKDYQLCVESREASLLGRREVLTGKAKFGIFGDGKEVPQVALAKQFENGDFRSGYYRDQTFMMAAGLTNLNEFFAQLYAHTDIEFDPHSGGRQMNSHYATRNINEDGTWKALTEQKNTSADISPTAGQMPRLLGLAYASKFYRNNKDLHSFTGFSNKGNEIAFGTIGDASTSEGHFWETVNAAGVLQVPMVLSVWDDGHGISVPKKFQTTKESISEALSGFKRTKDKPGFEILKVKGWDYAALCMVYEDAAKIAREEHVPVLVHVEEVTQPQGHSTSGSHERYKTPDRLAWEKNHDCIVKMREWILKSDLASTEELDDIEKTAKKTVRDAKKAAWSSFTTPIKSELNEVFGMLAQLMEESANAKLVLTEISNELQSAIDPSRKDIIASARKALRSIRNEQLPTRSKLQDWYTQQKVLNYDRYNSHLYSHSESSPLNVTEVPPAYTTDSPLIDGREVLKFNFDYILENNPDVLIFGEDSGKIGGVNQGLEGLQEKHGELRVFDTGIREQTIVGQAIGLALRGLRPIAEIQYLDYLLYGLQSLSDDAATTHYRTKGGQKCPLIIRTRGHRLEGIWHAGSPLGMMINALRGFHVCVPRNMVQAAGMYNTLIKGDDPGIVVESLNGYRLKETRPENIGEYTVPLGVPEIVKEGTDVTLVTYGSMVRMAIVAAQELEKEGISTEVIDVQTLLPFDEDHLIVESLAKTNRIIFTDEDVPGGATAYMMQKVLEEQGGYEYLDAEPRTLTSTDHRPAYGSDGDYFSKPSNEDLFDAVYNLMHESDPHKYPAIY